MNTLCYLFIYLFEQFVSFTYFNNKYERKISLSKICVAYLFSFCVQFSINFIKSPVLNLLTFFICNYIIAALCYIVKIKNTVFSILLLMGLMLTTELVVMYSFSAFSKMPLLDYEKHPYSMVFETVATKALYSTTVYFLSKINGKNRHLNHSGDFSLLFLPVVSIATAIVFNNILLKFDLDSTVYISFTVISFILLFSNVFVFLIHERIVSTLIKNTEYQMEIQKAEINREYYCELERQYEASNILIHDINKHLTIIKSLANDEDFDGITKYIESVYKDNEIQTLRQFSNNKLVNVIISRYFDLCNNSNITLSVDIRNIDFTFIDESELTALLNNLLENSYEAAVKSASKQISLNIDKKNEHFILFYLVNSCDNSPHQSGNIFTTSKKDTNRHGFGIKSINRIAKKYHGNAEFRYDELNNTFSSSVLIRIK